MVAEVFGGLAAFKNMLELAKSLHDLHDAVARDKAVFELQRQIITAQTDQMSLIETVSDLKKRLAEFETWEQEKLRYELKSIGYAFAYQLTGNRGEGATR